MPTLITLPESALIEILSLLGYKDLMNVAFTCHVLQGLALSDYLWMRFCKPWKQYVDLEKWRAGVDSARTLFRFLSSLSKLVGYWSAPLLAPQGGLIFVTWGHLSVLAYRIVVLQTGHVIMQHLFDVAASPNGISTKIFTTCLTPAGRRGLSLSGAVVWPSLNDDEFCLELAEYCEAVIHDMQQPDLLGEPDATSRRLNHNKALHLSHIFRSLDISFGIGSYDDDEDEDCAFMDGNHQVLHITSERDIEGSLYRRLKVEEPCVDHPFSGLWAGLYGTHGMEIMNLSYTRQEIVATKVLGEPNVPCSQITFKAKLETESSNIPPRLQSVMSAQDEAYASPFKIVTFYDGFGQIANSGFQIPEWVHGKLLVDKNDAIALLWEDDDYVIRYQKLDLPSMYECQKESWLVSIM